ncbi:MAG: hypothetical protein KGJ62_00860 [Armatimonadetes bacterium]|nr:hypothetical protein [Armatimonadota bacterium]MDE2205107.1 hypothetical protein [Armatimonadota bacterium]
MPLRLRLQRPAVRVLGRHPGGPIANRRVLQLLAHMVHPTAEYSGTQVTQRGGVVSRQQIEGDTRGRVVRTFLAPPDMAGDVMIVGPKQYRYYHRRTNTLDVALWPTQWNANVQRFLLLVQRGVVQAAVVGQETIAGRNAAIVALTAGAHQMKYWIDMPTGIELQNEVSGPSGLISRSYLESVTVGPTAQVQPSAFNLRIPNARVNTLYPGDQFQTLAEAAPHSPFAVLQPTRLPPGYSPHGVWVFGGRNPNPRATSLLLRYSNGVSSFSLYQHIAPATVRAQVPAAFTFRRSVERWVVSDGQRTVVVIYMGDLSPANVRAVYESLR